MPSVCGTRDSFMFLTSSARDSMKSISLLLLSSLGLALLLGGCDATGSEETAVLNADSPAPPTVEYTFRYDSDNVTDDGQRVDVVSDNSDNLGSVLTQNGFSRSDIVSARVDSVSLRRLSSASVAETRPKVFDYVTGVAVFLGTDASGTRIAERTPLPTQQQVSLQVATSNVTADLKGGSKSAFLRIDASGDVPEEDVVEATVYYRVEVEGV